MYIYIDIDIDMIDIFIHICVRSIYIYVLIHTHTDSGIHVGLQEGTALEIAQRENVEEVVAVLEEHMATGGEEEEKERT
jgi:hypothetical protein